jgi:hypothetical protein
LFDLPVAAAGADAALLRSLRNLQPNCAGLRVWRTGDGTVVALVTELGLGRSIANSAEQICARLAARFGPDTVVIEHWPAGQDSDEHFDQVVIDGSCPLWRRLPSDPSAGAPAPTPGCRVPGVMPLRQWRHAGLECVISTGYAAVNGYVLLPEPLNVMFEDLAELDELIGIDDGLTYLGAGGWIGCALEGLDHSFHLGELLGFIPAAGSEFAFRTGRFWTRRGEHVPLDRFGLTRTVPELAEAIEGLADNVAEVATVMAFAHEERKAQYLRRCLKLIEENGYMIQFVIGDERQPPPLGYTAGLCTREAAPFELAISGLDYERSGSLLRSLAERPIDWMPYEGMMIDDVLADGFALRLRAVSDVGQFTIARHVYGMAGPAWQVMWPDPEGRYPVDPGYRSDPQLLL